MSSAAPRIVPVSRLTCHATASNPIARREHPGARCGQLLGHAPTATRFVDVAAQAPSEPDGRIWVRCSRSSCRTWNIFEAVTP
jgi:hypothetical protein